MNVRIASEIYICWSFVVPSESRLWILPLIWVWPWDPLRLCDATAAPPQPRPGKTPAGQDPEVRIRHFKSPQQRSDQTDKAAHSEQDSCSFNSTMASIRSVRIAFRCAGRLLLSAPQPGSILERSALCA